jgi:hypothetical protein
MKKWAIARKLKITGARGTSIVAYVYWTGRDSRTDPLKGNAYRFESANAARQCANTHPMLRDSDDWCIVPVEGKSLVNKENA